MDRLRVIVWPGLAAGAALLMGGIWAHESSQALLLGLGAGTCLGAALMPLIAGRLPREVTGPVARGQAVLDTATAGIVTIDATGLIETFNGAAERMFGWTAAEVLGRNAKILMPEPFSSEHDGYIRRYRETREKRIIGIGREVEALRKDGSTFPIDLSVGEGWVEGAQFFVAVLTDLTERYEMQSKLTQAERLAAIGELAAGVAHEVNNPINTMINCAQLIQDGDDPQENSRIVMEEGQRIAEIVRDLLEFAASSGRQPQADALEETALPKVVARTVGLFGENLRRHGIELEVTVPADLPTAMARPSQLQQVLLNLLLNAKDAVREREVDRRVRIRGGVDGEHVFLTVEDNGPGIPQSIIHRVFEPFVTTKRASGGTGLGLSISRSLIESCGGRLTILATSTAGTTLKVALPQAD